MKICSKMFQARFVVLMKFRSFHQDSNNFWASQLTCNASLLHTITVVVVYFKYLKKHKYLFEVRAREDERQQKFAEKCPKL